MESMVANIGSIKIGLDSGDQSAAAHGSIHVNFDGDRLVWCVVINCPATNQFAISRIQNASRGVVGRGVRWVNTRQRAAEIGGIWVLTSITWRRITRAIGSIQSDVHSLIGI